MPERDEFAAYIDAMHQDEEFIREMADYQREYWIEEAKKLEEV